MTPGWNLPFIGSVLRYAELPVATIVLSSIAGWMGQNAGYGGLTCETSQAGQPRRARSSTSSSTVPR